MRNQRPSPGQFGVAWVVLGVALCGSFAVWGSRVDSALHSGTAIVAPAPVATALPSIVTVNEGVAASLPANLCVQLSPQVKLITVESVSGVVITTLRC
jgi:hypothetical protein